MPALDTKHPLRKTRWALTVLALLFLSLWVVGGWCRVIYQSGGRFAMHFTGGNTTIFVTLPPKRPAPPRFESKWLGPWPHGQSSLHLSIILQGGFGSRFRFTCPLFVPALVFGVFAGLLWYRRARPFNRLDRPNRSRQFRRTRWTFTALVPVIVAIALAGHWVQVSYHGPHLRLESQRGMLTSSYTSYRGGVSPQFWGWNTAPVVSIYQPGSPQPIVLGGTAFLATSSFGPSVELTLSLWFLAVFLSIPTAFLWFIHLRRYPVGRCPHCQYNLAGLAANAPCPECGRTAGSAG